MPRVSAFLICDLNEQPSLVIDASAGSDGVTDCLINNLKKIEEYIKSKEEYISDTPFAAYYSKDVSKLQIEVGFHIRRHISGKGDIRFASVPGGKAVTFIYVGKRSSIMPVYKETVAWMKEKELDPAGYVVEYYYGSGQRLEGDNLITKVVVPLK